MCEMLKEAKHVAEMAWIAILSKYGTGKRQGRIKWGLVLKCRVMRKGWQVLGPVLNHLRNRCSPDLGPSVHQLLGRYFFLLTTLSFICIRIIFYQIMFSADGFSVFGFWEAMWPHQLHYLCGSSLKKSHPCRTADYPSKKFERTIRHLGARVFKKIPALIPFTSLAGTRGSPKRVLRWFFTTCVKFELVVHLFMICYIYPV